MYYNTTFVQVEFTNLKITKKLFTYILEKHYNILRITFLFVSSLFFFFSFRDYKKAAVCEELLTARASREKSGNRDTGAIRLAGFPLRWNSFDA